MLSCADFERILDAVLALQKIVPFRDFPRHAISATSKLLSVDVCSYGEVDLFGRHAAGLSNDIDSVSNPLMQAWARNTVGPEVLPSWQLLRPLDVITLSDFVSQDELRSKQIWQDYFREIDVQYQAIVPFLRESSPAHRELALAGADEPAGTLDLVCSMGFGRAKHDFSSKDREILRRIAPHLQQAYLSAETLEFARLDRNLMVSDSQWGRVRAGLIVLTEGGLVTAATANARRWVTEHFGGFPSHSSALPEDLRRWVAFNLENQDGERSEQRLRSPLEVQRGDRQLVITLVGNADGQGLMLLLRHHQPYPDALAKEILGLTDRELELARWLTRGNTNPEIGQILGISARTVQAHLRNIFQKLDVPNRASATTKILELLSTNLDQHE